MLRSNSFFLWGLRRKAEPAPLPANPANKMSKLFQASFRGPDQRHQDERDDIATSALKPGIRLLEDRAAGLPDRHNSNRSDKIDTLSPIPVKGYTGRL